MSERTGGVPLFVEEVTRLLLERGEQGGLQAIPPTLQQSLAARLDRLGDAREVAQIGAVLGRDFSYALLRAVGGVDNSALQSSLDRGHRQIALGLGVALVLGELPGDAEALFIGRQRPLKDDYEPAHETWRVSHVAWAAQHKKIEADRSLTGCLARLTFPPSAARRSSRCAVDHPRAPNAKVLDSDDQSKSRISPSSTVCTAGISTPIDRSAKGCGLNDNFDGMLLAHRSAETKSRMGGAHEGNASVRHCRLARRRGE